MEFNRTDIESLVRKILLEELAGKGSAKRVYFITKFRCSS